MILVTEKNIMHEVYQAEKPVAILFTSPTCGPCKVLKRQMESVDPSEINNCKIVEVDTYESPQIARAFIIRKVPSLVILNRVHVMASIQGCKFVDVVETLADLEV